MADESQNVKIEFPLEVEDGFPPIRVELLHARPVNADQFQVLNSPFFVENVAYGDLVTVTVEADGRRTFKACADPSGFTSLGIIVLEQSVDSALLDLFRGLGCVIEFGEFGKLRMFAVSIPASVDYHSIQAVLDDLEAADKISYAELALGQSIQGERAEQ